MPQPGRTSAEAQRKTGKTLNISGFSERMESLQRIAFASVPSGRKGLPEEGDCGKGDWEEVLLYFGMLRRFLFLFVFLALFAVLASAAAMAWLVMYAPGARIGQDNIEKILAVESPVFYSDGVHKVGVFFEEAHRQYVTYDRIPPPFVKEIGRAHV